MRQLRLAISGNAQALRNDLQLSEQLASRVRGGQGGRSQVRRISYIAGIVSLYGLIEQSVDQILLETAKVLNRIHPTLDSLPEKIRLEFRALALNSLVDGS